MSHSIVSSDDLAENYQLEEVEHEEVTQRIAAAAVNRTTAAILDRCKADKDYITNTVLLAGATAADEAAASLGNTLCAELMNVMDQLEPTFKTVIINAYPLAAAMEECARQSAALQERISELAQLTIVEPSAPSSLQSNELELLQLEMGMHAEHLVTRAALEAPDATGQKSKAADIASAIAAADRAYQGRLDQAKLELRVKFLTLQHETQLAHETRRGKFVENKQALGVAMAMLQNLASVGALLNLHRTLSAALGQKVKNRLIAFPVLMNVMATSVVPVTTRVAILDVLSGPSLPGIFHILWQKFRKPTPAQFATAAMKLVNYRTPEDLPSKAIQAIDVQMQQWQRKKYNTMLTVDFLFGLVLANCLADSSRPRYIAMEALDLACKEVAAGNALHPGEPYPIFKHVKEALIKHEEYAQPSTPVQPALAPAQPATPQLKPGGYPIRTRYMPKGNAEFAAVADETADVASELTLITATTKKFTELVPRARNFGVVSKVGKTAGRTFPYAAMPTAQQVCPKCFGTPPNKCGCHSTGVMCDKCQLFGHKTSECHQQVGKGVTKPT